MSEYLSFQFDWQQRRHNPSELSSGVDLNESRAQAHLRALIRGCGSSTESIVNDFVTNDVGSISKYESVQKAWQRLDGEQQHFVIAFRDLMEKPVLGDFSNFPHLFYIQTIQRKYLDILQAYERDHGEQSSTIEQQILFAEKAKKIVTDKITTESTGAVYVVEQDSDD